MKVFADTSFLLAFLIESQESPEICKAASRWVRKHPEISVIWISDFVDFEIKNVMRKMSSRGGWRGTRLDSAGLAEVLDKFEELKARRLLQLALRQVSQKDLSCEAQSLMELSREPIGTGAMDAFIVATARWSVWGRGGKASPATGGVFLSFDKNQRTLAKIAGFEVQPPMPKANGRAPAASGKK